MGSLSNNCCKREPLFLVSLGAMKVNQYISVLLLTLFMTKFLVMDAKILSWTMESDQVVLVNPFCKKKRDQPKDLETQITEASLTEVNYMAVPCSTVFQVESHHWTLLEQDLPYAVFGFNVPLMEGLYQDQNSPPPRIA